MAGKKKFAINVVMNWVAMATGMAVPFFLAPFVVRHLGTTVYGIWILAVSTVAYLNMLDLGLRSAIVRFVSKSAAEGKIDDAQRAIGATLWVRLVIAAVVAIFSILLAIWFPHVFKVPLNLQRASQITVLFCAMGIAVSLLSSVYSGILTAINRFDILSSVNTAHVLCRAGGVILILRSGHGLVALAIWEFAIILCAGLAFLIAAMIKYPPCRILVFRPDAKTLKSISSYSFKTFIIIVAVQIVFYTDNVVVGAFLSVGIVTFYSIGGSLAMYSGQVSTSMGSTFIPMASKFDASGESKSLQTLLLRGTQAMLGLMLPIGLTLLFRGKTFIGLWMGHQFSEISGTILQILLISQFFTIANSTAGQIAFGVDKHKSVATWAAVEALLNLGLSLVLVKTIGIYGVAWGTSLSQALIHLIFWPRFVKRELGVPVWRYLWDGWLKVSALSIPFAIASAAADKYWHASSLVGFFGQVFAILPVYAVCAVWLFTNEIKAVFRSWRRSRQSPLREPA